MARKKKKPLSRKYGKSKRVESFTGDTGLIYPAGLASQRNVRKNKKNYKMVSYKNRRRTSGEDLIPKQEKYWVGTLEDVGVVLYDPGVNTDESKNILLFVLKRNQMAVFDRNDTRSKIRKVTSQGKTSEVEAKYKLWRKINHSE